MARSNCGNGRTRTEDQDQDLPEIQLTRTHHFDVGAIPSAVTGLKESILIATYVRGILECSIDGEVLRIIPNPRRGEWSLAATMIVEWRKLLYVMYDKEGHVWDGERNTLRTIPRYDSIFVWNNELLCCRSSENSRPGSNYSVWDICSWKPTLHHRYPRETRDAIRTWISWSWKQHLPRDTTLVIARMLADEDIGTRMKRPKQGMR